MEQKENILDISVMRMGPASFTAREEGAFASAPGAFSQRADAAPLVAALRAHITRLEQAQARFDEARGAARGRMTPWMMGEPELDRHLPAQGLVRNGLHDVSPRAYGDMPAAMGFTLALALRRLSDTQERRPLLWCRLEREEREYGRLYGHGLERLGLARARFVTITLKKPAALMWTMEEALKSGALAVVIGDADAAQADLTVTRRLSLAAAAGKSAALLTFARPDASATASHTRWLAGSAASRSPPHDPWAPGLPAWSVDLTRARGGRPGAWILEWHHALHRFSVVSGLSGRALHPGEDQAGQARPAPGHALRTG
jgi:protein ImuA